MKTLKEYIVESDSDVDLVIKAAADIHTPEMMNAIRRALEKYDLRELKPGSRRAAEIKPKEFPEVYCAEVFTVDAVVGIRPPTGGRGVGLEIGMLAMIPDKLIKVSVDGEEQEELRPLDDPLCLGNTTNARVAVDRIKDRITRAIIGTGMGDHDSDEEFPDAQSLVGQKRVDDMMDEYEKSYADHRLEAGKAIEKFVMGHIDLREATGVGRRKGFYVCEAGEDGSIHVLEGPLAAVPEGLKLRA